MFCDYLIFWFEHFKRPPLSGRERLSDGIIVGKPKRATFLRRSARKAKKQQTECR